MNTPRRSFMKQVALGAASLAAAPQFIQLPLRAAEPGRGSLPRSTPEAQGVNSRGILAFLDALASSSHEFHSLMIARHGRVIAEGWWKPYRPAAPHMLYSLSKSFTSTAVGLAVSEGLLTVNDKVTKFFPDDVPAVISENLAALRVRDLLSMSVGHAEDSTGSLWGKENWVKQFLSLPIKYAPGTVFLYNSGATYMCSAIVQKLTGLKMLDYLRPRLFGPLGIEGMTWETCPRGINTGGWGLKLPTEALAKFAQLLLQKGRWEGKQLVSADWIEEATSFKIQQPTPDLEGAKKNSDWHQGYCYQFWRCRHDGFRGDGAFGQYAIVLPKQDAVIAITSESPNMQGQLNLIWEHLLPAMTEQALPEQRELGAKLKERLSALAIPAVAGQGSCSLAEQISGKEFAVEGPDDGPDSLKFDFSGTQCVVTVLDGKGTHSVQHGLGRWQDGETDIQGMPPQLTRGPLPPVSKLAACAAWTSADTLQLRWQFFETPHHVRIGCKFTDGGKKVEVSLLDSLAEMGGRKESRPPIIGTLK